MNGWIAFWLLVAYMAGFASAVIVGTWWAKRNKRMMNNQYRRN